MFVKECALIKYAIVWVLHVGRYRYTEQNIEKTSTNKIEFKTKTKEI